MKVVRVDTRETGSERGVRSRIYFWDTADFVHTRYDGMTVKKYERLVPKALKQIGVQVSHTDFWWHHTAGYTSAAATPGFVMRRHIHIDGKPVDIHVWVSDS